MTQGGCKGGWKVWGTKKIEQIPRFTTQLHILTLRKYHLTLQLSNNQLGTNNSICPPCHIRWSYRTSGQIHVRINIFFVLFLGTFKWQLAWIFWTYKTPGQDQKCRHRFAQIMEFGKMLHQTRGRFQTDPDTRQNRHLYRYAWRAKKKGTKIWKKTPPLFQIIWKKYIYIYELNIVVYDVP